jgi:hypothetical protein
MKRKNCKEAVQPVFRYYAVHVKGCMKSQLKYESLIFMYIFPNINMFRTSSLMFIDTLLFLFVLHGGQWRWYRGANQAFLLTTTMSFGKNQN